MPHQIRNITNRLDELRLSSNTLPYELTDEDDEYAIFQFDTDNNRYILTLDQFPNEEYDRSGTSYLEIEFVTHNLKTGVRGSQLSKENTNIGEPQLIQVYATIANIVVDYVYENPQISEITCAADTKKLPIYTRLFRSNIAHMLPEFKIAGSTTLVRIEDEDEFNNLQLQRQANIKRPNM